MSNIKISEMAEAESLNDNDLLTIVQGGINKKITKQNAIGDIIQAINNPTYTTTEGTDLSIDNTRVGKMKFEYYGDTSQRTNLFNNDIVQGAISEGADISATNRIRTSGYIQVVASTSVPITFTGCDDWYASLYNSSKTYTGGIGWKSTSEALTIPSGIAYIRLAFRKNDNSDITPASISNVQIGTTPSPDYPQEVKTVNSENTIDIVGRNLINPNSPYGTSLGITTTYNSENQSLSFSGTTTGTWAYLTNKINVNIPKGEYTFSIDKTVSTHTVIFRMFYNETQYQDVTIYTNTTSRTFDITNDTISYQIYMGGLSSGVSLNDTLNFQIEKGSTANIFEEFKEQSYELNLGKNLFKPFSFVSRLSNGLTSMRNDDNSITMIGTTTAITNHWLNDLNMRLPKGTYTFSTSCDLTGRMTFVLKDSGGNNVISFNSGKTYTFTLATDTTIGNALIQVSSGITMDETFTLQLEKRKCCYNIRAIFYSNRTMQNRRLSRPYL